MQLNDPLLKAVQPMVGLDFLPAEADESRDNDGDQQCEGQAVQHDAVEAVGTSLANSTWLPPLAVVASWAALAECHALASSPLHARESFPMTHVGREVTGISDAYDRFYGEAGAPLPDGVAPDVADMVEGVARQLAARREAFLNDFAAKLLAAGVDPAEYAIECHQPQLSRNADQFTFTQDIRIRKLDPGSER